MSRSYDTLLTSIQETDLKGRSKSFKAIHQKLKTFDDTLKTKQTDKEKLYHFASEEMEDLLDAIDHYIGTHHPLTSKGQEQFKQIVELGCVLDEMSKGGKEMVAYDGFLNRKVTYSLERADELTDRNEFESARFNLKIATLSLDENTINPITIGMVNKLKDINSVYDGIDTKAVLENCFKQTEELRSTTRMKYNYNNQMEVEFRNKPFEARVKTNFKEMTKPSAIKGASIKQASEPAKDKAAPKKGFAK